MIKIICYKTTQEKIKRTFCKLAEKCFYNSKKVFVYTNNKEETLYLDTSLWTYSNKQFIPHATIYDKFPEKQPILIGSELKNFNSALNLIIVNPDKKKIAYILSLIQKLNVQKYERLFFLCDMNSSPSNQDINNLIIGSSLSYNFNIDFYVQNNSNFWHLQKHY